MGLGRDDFGERGLLFVIGCWEESASRNACWVLDRNFSLSATSEDPVRQQGDLWAIQPHIMHLFKIALLSLLLLLELAFARACVELIGRFFTFIPMALVLLSSVGTTGLSFGLLLD